MRLLLLSVTLASSALGFGSVVRAESSGTPSNPTPTGSSYSAKWKEVIDHGDLSSLMKTYALVTQMYGGRWSVTAEECKREGSQLANAVRVNPMSFAVRSLEVDCAKAIGPTSVAVEREEYLRSLMQQAVNELPPENAAFEQYSIPVFSEIDAYAFARESGEHVLSAHYDVGPWFKYASLGLDLWNPSSLHERTLWFDWFNAVLEAAHDPDTRFPDYRANAAKQVLGKVATPGSSAQAVSESLAAIDLGGRAGLAKEESLAAEGNYPAMVQAVTTCLTVKEFDCSSAGTKMLQPWLKQENSWARIEMAFAYAGGIGVEKNPAAALDLIQMVDKRRGDRSGMFEFAVRRFPANGNKIDPVVRTDVLALASNGNPVAELLVANEARSSLKTIHFEGRVLEGLKHAAAVGLPTAQYLLGEHLLGVGNDAAGVEWLEKAASSGNPYSQAALADIYRNATNGQAHDSKRRVQWDELAQQVLLDPLSMTLIGMEYLKRMPSNAVNTHIAERWLQNGAAGGDRYGSIWLAHLYESGAPGVSGGHDDAVALYRSLVSSSATDAAARWYLARLLSEQSDAGTHKKEIEQLLKEAAENGDGSSQGELASDLLFGHYVPADPKEAAKWYRLAIKNGDIRSISDYARMLMDGVWIPLDTNAALALWRRAITKDDHESKEAMAWALCTNPELIGLGLKEGLRLAKSINPVDQSAYDVDTLAACYGAAGDFTQAIELEDKAIAMLQRQHPADAINLNDFNDHLARYNRGLPYVSKDPTLQIKAGDIHFDAPNAVGKK